MTEEKTDLIYFVRAGDWVKIGITKNLPSRLNKMQCDCPLELTVLATIPGDESKEREIQREFRHLKMRGEWYCLSFDLRKYISKLNKQKPANKPASEAASKTDDGAKREAKISAKLERHYAQLRIEQAKRQKQKDEEIRNAEPIRIALLRVLEKEDDRQKNLHLATALSFLRRGITPSQVIAVYGKDGIWRQENSERIPNGHEVWTSIHRYVQA